MLKEIPYSRVCWGWKIFWCHRSSIIIPTVELNFFPWNEAFNGHFEPLEFNDHFVIYSCVLTLLSPLSVSHLPPSYLSFASLSLPFLSPLSFSPLIPLSLFHTHTCTHTHTFLWYLIFNNVYKDSSLFSSETHSFHRFNMCTKKISL